MIPAEEFKKALASAAAKKKKNVVKKDKELDESKLSKKQAYIEKRREEKATFREALNGKTGAERISTLINDRKIVKGSVKAFIWKMANSLAAGKYPTLDTVKEEMRTHPPLQVTQMRLLLEYGPADLTFHHPVLRRHQTYHEFVLSVKAASHVRRQFHRVVLIRLLHGFRYTIQALGLGDHNVDAQVGQYPVYLVGLGRILYEYVCLMPGQRLGYPGHVLRCRCLGAIVPVEIFQELVLSFAGFAVAGEDRITNSCGFVKIHSYCYSHTIFLRAPNKYPRARERNKQSLSKIAIYLSLVRFG